LWVADRCACSADTPHYCGSCWAHAALSSLSDRIKIARRGRGIDINLSVQWLLNCGKGVAGSCNGGHHVGVYQLIHESPHGAPYETCMPYEACSADSEHPSCKLNNYECSAINSTSAGLVAARVVLGRVRVVARAVY
jgi:cathepsin X